jgi:SAM-dependent methyltransferase
MRSDQSEFWDERFRREGAIWGTGPSPTATAIARHLPPSSRLLEIGFGYGRDLAFLSREGFRVYGVDFSSEARRATEERLRREGLVAERLVTGSFVDCGFPEGSFDGVYSHRMAHLLTTAAAVESFVETVSRLLRVGGILCLTVRNSEDCKPEEVRPVEGEVYEYIPRHGHYIRFWGDRTLKSAFGTAFHLLAFDGVTEPESAERPVPCWLTVMVGKKVAANGVPLVPTLAAT